MPDFAHHWQSQLRERIDQWATERAELNAFAADASARIAAADAECAALRVALAAAQQQPHEQQQLLQHQTQQQQSQEQQTRQQQQQQLQEQPQQQQSAPFVQDTSDQLQALRAALQLAADRQADAEERARTAECMATESATQAAMVWRRERVFVVIVPPVRS